jgi:hypothetical protein
MEIIDAENGRHRRRGGAGLRAAIALAEADPACALR